MPRPVSRVPRSWLEAVMFSAASSLVTYRHAAPTFEAHSSGDRVAQTATSRTIPFTVATTRRTCSLWRHPDRSVHAS